MLFNKVNNMAMFNFLNCPHANKNEPKDGDVFAVCRDCGKPLRRFKGVFAGMATAFLLMTGIGAAHAAPTNVTFVTIAKPFVIKGYVHKRPVMHFAPIVIRVKAKDQGHNPTAFAKL